MAEENTTDNTTDNVYKVTTGKLHAEKEIIKI